MTDPVDWSLVAEIFADALDRPPEARAAWVAERCAGDAPLRAAVERMLAADASADADFLAGPDPGLLSEAASTLSEAPVERVGPWRLVREIGRGGMGRVFLAERDDGQFEQRVAVKLLKRGMDSDAILARFLRERQILAGLEHPNIARLLDGGVAEDGRPYFVMEYVDGEPITAFADGHRLDVDARITLFRTVCRAVGHAHRNLVVHRDLKPSNILVTREGEPKLLDFGIAKLLAPGGHPPDTPTLTVGDVRLMTPAYAAPEQLSGGAVTTATDVYGLGAVLYELLSGRPPFPESPNRLHLPLDAEPGSLSGAADRAPEGTVRNPAESSAGRDPAPHEPLRPEAPPSAAAIARARDTDPRRLRRRLTGDLDTIAAVALRADPTRRYASADAFEADLRRHQERLPVRARPDTLGYRASRFVRRHRVPAAAAVLTVLLSVAYGVTATLQARALQSERDRARREAAVAREVSDFMVGVFQTADPMVPGSGDTIRASDLLDRGARRVEEELAEQPEIQARLLGVIGEAYNNLGWTDRAEPLLARSVEIDRQLGDVDPGETVTALHRLAAVQANRSRYDDAVASLEEAMDLQEATDPDSPRSWVLLVALAETYHGRGDVANGREVLGRAMERFREIDYQGSPGERSALSAMTAMLGSAPDPASADAVFRRVAALERRESGGRSDRYAALLVQWGLARARQGDVAAADSLQSEAVAIYRAHGPPTLALADALRQQASYTRVLGEPERTLALAEESVRIMESILGADHVDIAPARTSLGEAQGRMGLHDAAVASMVRVVDAYERAGDSILLGPGRWRLAVQLEDAGRIEAADRTYRSALEAFGAAFPDDYLLTANVRLDYGEMLAAQGRAEEAEGMLRRALPVLVERWGEESLRADMVRVPLGVALADLGRTEEARTLLEPVVARLEADPGPEHPLTRRAEETLERIQGLP